MSRRSKAFRLVLGSAVALTGALGAAYGLQHRPAVELRLPQLGWSKTSADRDRCDLTVTIAKARDLVVRFKEEVGTPGIVVAVSVDGETVWAEGAGLADVENGVPCRADTVMRVASISKSIAMALVARQWEAGRLDMDAPVQRYLPDFPEKDVDGERVALTPRHLANHLSGVRHYAKRGDTPTKGEGQGDGEEAEFYLTQRCDSVAQGVAIFKDDELMHKPGSKFLYSTHGWTLLSAVCEAVAGQPFARQLAQLFQELGMRHTHLDHHRQILHGRARMDLWRNPVVRVAPPFGRDVKPVVPLVFDRIRLRAGTWGYVRAADGRLRNAEFADVSCKWAGGGVASTAPDLLRFAHAMRSARLVSVGTLRTMWTPHPLAQKAVSPRGRDAGYGLGWMVVPAIPAHVPAQVPRVGHSGGAVGASSELLISPTVAVAAIINLQGVSLHPLVSELMLLFEVHAEPKADWDWNTDKSR